MIYGYCRISTKEQNIERQVRNIIKEFSDAYILKEIFTGTTQERKEWQKLISKVKEGDTIVFDSVSRMSRSAKEGFEIYEDLFNKNVQLVFLKEPHINTETYRKALQNNVTLTGTNVDFILEGVNKYLMELAKEQILLAFIQSQKEVDDLRQRTREGMVTAKLNGKQIGRAKGQIVNTKKGRIAMEGIKKYSKDFSGSLNDVDCMRLLGLSRKTYYKYKKILKDAG